MSSLTAKRWGNERERNSIVVVTVNIHGLIEFSINVYMEEEECVSVCVCVIHSVHSCVGSQRRTRKSPCLPLPPAAPLCRTAPPPPRCRSAVVVREYSQSRGARHSSNVFPEAMRHLLLPDFLKAPDAADTVCLSGR